MESSGHCVGILFFYLKITILTRDPEAATCTKSQRNDSQSLHFGAFQLYLLVCNSVARHGSENSLVWVQPVVRVH